MKTEDNPLIKTPPEEVPLANAPLVCVLAQVRFPLIASIEKRDFIAPFQEDIRETYPVLRPEQVRGVIITPQGVSEAPSNNIWRFSELEEKGWRVSLAPDFLALETKSYTSRNDFLDRLERVLISLKTHINPSVIDRLGIRYIDRISGKEEMPDIKSLVRSEVAGIVSTELGKQVQHTLTESIFNLPNTEDQLLARWGLLPARGTIDPSTIEPLDKPSWILDLDIYRAKQQDFKIELLMIQARQFAERIYTVFRWIVTDNFLRQYGGNV
jgi:uncharacterized protein (TIGR04255 family)